MGWSTWGDLDPPFPRACPRAATRRRMRKAVANDRLLISYVLDDARRTARRHRSLFSLFWDFFSCLLLRRFAQGKLRRARRGAGGKAKRRGRRPGVGRGGWPRYPAPGEKCEDTCAKYLKTLHATGARYVVYAGTYHIIRRYTVGARQSGA